MKKKVLAVTGIRSEYDILYPVLKALANDPAFELKVVVTGAHLSDWHGFTVKQIEKDGFTIAERIDSLFLTDRVTQRAKGAGVLALSLSQTVEREQPDILLVVGDREESIATAMVGNYMDVLVAHIGGGDTVFGNADDPVRFAVSKLAHIHFPFAQAYADNLLKIGEEEFRVFNVGDPGLDNILNVPVIQWEDVKRAIEWTVEPGRFFTILYHPLSSEKDCSCEQMDMLLSTCERFCVQNDIKAVGIFPNTDPGSSGVLESIKKNSGSGHIRFYKTLPRDVFVNIMRNSLMLVGNSSMGVLEAPFYELPVVNVGNRQKGRINAGNVLFVEHDDQSVMQAMQKSCFDESYRRDLNKCKDYYGEGKTAEKIVKILSDIDPRDRKWHIKRRLC
jgi:GDP/UDP-N,N'-diacetylbacillosamine 2-epimerase (hydrolysing)